MAYGIEYISGHLFLKTKWVTWFTQLFGRVSLYWGSLECSWLGTVSSATIHFCLEFMDQVSLPLCKLVTWDFSGFWTNGEASVRVKNTKSSDFLFFKITYALHLFNHNFSHIISISW
jgi:hypothetical protein